MALSDPTIHAEFLNVVCEALEKSEDLKLLLKKAGEKHDRGSKEQYVAAIEFMIKYYCEVHPKSDVRNYIGNVEKAIEDMNGNLEDDDVKSAVSRLRVITLNYSSK